MNATVPSTTSAAAAPDITLVLARLEKQILAADNLDECRRILSRQDLWGRADTTTQLRWVHLAQMAGDTDTALAVLAWINTHDPSCAKAWTEHLEMLALLGRRQDVVRVLAAAKGHLSTPALKPVAALVQAVASPAGHGEDLPEADEPFVRAKAHQQLLERYLDLFSGREDCFARQWADKAKGQQGYTPVRQPMTTAEVEEHLRGRKTYGIYILRSDATIKAAVIDMDLKPALRGRPLAAEEKDLVRRERIFAIQRIIEMGRAMGFEPLLEFSGGKGFHFWFLLARPLAAAPVKAALERVRAGVAGDLKAFELEVFPKQSSLSGKGLGNLVKLPLGIHRLSGKQSFFVACKNRDVSAQLGFLARVMPSQPEQIKLAALDGGAQVIEHPKRRQWTEQYPELGLLEQRCLPLAQVLATCRSGQQLSVREEKIIYQTIGLLPRAKTLIHHLAAFDPEYNPHLVDYKLSRLRGSPLGCRRIHSLLTYTGDFCLFTDGRPYDHPLLHLPQWCTDRSPPAENIVNLQDALDNLQSAMDQVRRFIPGTPQQSARQRIEG